MAGKRFLANENIIPIKLAYFVGSFERDLQNGLALDEVYKP